MCRDAPVKGQLLQNRRVPELHEAPSGNVNTGRCMREKSQSFPRPG